MLLCGLREAAPRGSERLHVPPGPIMIENSTPEDAPSRVRGPSRCLVQVLAEGCKDRRGDRRRDPDGDFFLSSHRKFEGARVTPNDPSSPPSWTCPWSSASIPVDRPCHRFPLASSFPSALCCKRRYSLEITFICTRLLHVNFSIFRRVVITQGVYSIY